MSPSGTAADPPDVQEPKAHTGPLDKRARELKRRGPFVLVILTILGWSAAAFAFLHRFDDQEQHQPTAVLNSEGQDRSLTVVSTTQQDLARTRSALSMTTRLRDRAAQALQEVMASSAVVKRDLSAARDQLDDIKQKIIAGNTELSTINKRLETARLRETEEKRKGNARPHLGGKATLELTTPQKPLSSAPTAETSNGVSSKAAASHAAPAPTPATRDQDRNLTQTSTTQQQLAKAQSALSMTTKLRDEAAQALQEVRDKSVAAKKDLAEARNQLDDLQRKITSHNAELSTIDKRLEAARSLETEEMRKGSANSRLERKPGPEPGTVVPANPQEVSASMPTAKARDSVLPETLASPATAPTPAGRVAATAAVPVPVQPSATRPESAEPRSKPIDHASPPAAFHPTSISKSSVGSSADAMPSKARKLSDNDRSGSVIGPGALSPPTDFERHSRRTSRTP